MYYQLIVLLATLLDWQILAINRLWILDSEFFFERPDKQDSTRQTTIRSLLVPAGPKSSTAAGMNPSPGILTYYWEPFTVSEVEISYPQ